MAIGLLLIIAASYLAVRASNAATRLIKEVDEEFGGPRVTELLTENSFSPHYVRAVIPVFLLIFLLIIAALFYYAGKASSETKRHAPKHYDFKKEEELKEEENEEKESEKKESEEKGESESESGNDGRETGEFEEEKEKRLKKRKR